MKWYPYTICTTYTCIYIYIYMEIMLVVHFCTLWVRAYPGRCRAYPWLLPLKYVHSRDQESKADIWWRHQIETFSALLALYAGNSPVSGEFPSQRPVTRSFDVLFDLRLYKRLSKQWWGWWYETPSRSLWSHCNGISTPLSRRSRHCLVPFKSPGTNRNPHPIWNEHCLLN